MAGNTNCSSRYLGVLKLHARGNGQYGSVIGVTDTSNYLVTFESIEEIKDHFKAFMCRTGYGSYPYRAYIIDQVEHKIVATMGVDPVPSAPWTDVK